MSLAQGTWAEQPSRGKTVQENVAGERQCQESCTNYNPTSSFSRDD